jgi:hypothetical protein
MKNFFNFISGLFLFYLVFLFLKWYIKGHFGKYFIFFWLNTFISTCVYFSQKAKHGSKLEYENIKSYNN